MKFKPLIIELLQASSFAVVLTFLFAIIGFEKSRYVFQLAIVAFVFGGLPVMLAKRFLISYFKEVKQL